MRPDDVSERGPAGVLSAIEQALEALGYRAGLRMHGYTFADYDGPVPILRKIPLAAFGQDPPSTKTACIGVVFGQHTPEELAVYRALGAPVLITATTETVQQWKVRAAGPPELLETTPIDEVVDALIRRKTDWSPLSILRAKSIGFDTTTFQTDFYDFDLLPAIERVVRKKLDVLLSRAIAAAESAYQEHHPDVEPDYQGLFRLVFRLLAAKVLADRQHEGDWLAGDPALVMRRVEQFYYPQGDVPPAWDDAHAQAAAWHHIASDLKLQNVSLDTLAWIWEHTLVSDLVRRRLSIHGTRPEIAEYMVRRLPFESLPRKARTVFEPFAGPAVFLVSALRRLRELLLSEGVDWSGWERHQYFIQMLSGMEVDAFAIEIARLTLMLADYPYPTGWDLRQRDVFAATDLEQSLAQANIVLCNPPFERVPTGERSAYELISVNQAADILARVLKAPPALLGFVLPRVFRDGLRFRTTRRRIAESYGQIEIVELPDRAFSHSSVESVLLLAHGAPAAKANLRAGSVEPTDLDWFLSRGDPSTVRVASVTPDEAEVTLWTYPLERVWAALREHKTLGSLARVHRGLQYELPLRTHRAELISDVPRSGFAPGLSVVTDDFEPFFVGSHVFINTVPEMMRKRNARVYARPWDRPKVVVNAHRKSRGAWPLTAVPDYSGLICYQNFHGIWPEDDALPIEVLAAVLNGQVANAFVSVREEKRDNRRITIEAIPFPDLDRYLIETLRDLVSRYRVERQELEAHAVPEVVDECRVLRAEINHAVLSAYSLPSQERRDLDAFFEGTEQYESPRLTQAGLVGEGTTLPLFRPTYRRQLGSEASEGDIEAADSDAERLIESLAPQLRERRPDLFDSSGNLQRDAARELLAQLTQGKKTLTRDEIIGIGRRNGT